MVGRTEANGSSTSKQILASLVVALVALNLAIGFIVSALKLPLYLDAIGVVLAGVLVGPVVGAIVGVSTAVVGTVLVNQYLWAYSLTGLAIGVSSGMLARAGLMSGPGRAILSGLIIAVIAAFVSAPVTVLMFGGATASGVDLLTVFFKEVGHTLWESVLLSGFASEPVDKVIATLLAWYIGRSLPNRILVHFPGARRRLGTQGS